MEETSEQLQKLQFDAPITGRVNTKQLTQNLKVCEVYLIATFS